jgi:hypothetical protein
VGETEQIRFSAANNHPRLWFRCMNPTESGCEKEQTIACKTDRRSLIPLARTEPLYHELSNRIKVSSMPTIYGEIDTGSVRTRSAFDRRLSVSTGIVSAPPSLA